MNQDINNNPAFCTFEEWIGHAPTEFRELTLAQWLAKSRRGDWAPYLKPFGERSTPYWRRTDLVIYFRLKWNVLYPTAVESLLKAGFPEPEQPKYKMVKKKKGGRYAS